MSLNLSNKNLENVENIFSEIINPEKYTSIDLSNNLLKNLPKNLSLFKSIHSINLINNKFTDYNSIAKNLSSLPELQDLNIDLATQENVLIILSALPDLVTLNGQLTAENETLQKSFVTQSNTILENNTENDKKNEISLNEETNDFEFIYKELNDDNFNKKFQEKLREEITKINNNLDISNRLYNAIIVKSKLEIYSFILNEVINLIVNNDKNIESVIKIINLVIDKLKYNQNILFGLVMSNDNNNDTNNKKINNDIIKLELNKNISSYEISKEISIVDTLFSFDNEISSNKIKIMPKNNLITLLDQIYEYKIKNNFDYNHAIIPFLTAKYGLKSIAKFWFNKILEGINFYIDNDKKNKYSEIYLIKKILEQELDEYFYIKYKKTKIKYINYINKIKDLLECNKNQDNISYEEGMKLLMDNIKDINDSKDININEIAEQVKITNEERKDHLNENFNNIVDVLCGDFINILLKVLVEKREKQYNCFLSNFKVYDKEEDGLINKEEFIEMIYSFKNKYILNNNKIISELCIDLFPKGKLYISINNCIEILSKRKINNNKTVFDSLLSIS